MDRSRPIRADLFHHDAAPRAWQFALVSAWHADEFRAGRRLWRRPGRRLVRWRLFRRRRVVRRRRRIGGLVMVHLPADDQHRVSAAIKAAEATTSGEIVCVLARASSSYMTYASAWSALIALIAPWL